MWAIVGVISIMGLAVIALLFITQRKSLRDNSLTAQKGITPGWIIFFVVLVCELGAGYYFHINGYFMGDAVSRVANAFYVLYIQPAHLAAIGFVWNPLPSLLELPFMPLVQIYKPLATAALAGVIVASLFTAGTAFLIYKNCRHFNVPNWATLIMVSLFAFNPFIFIYGFNGMSEGIFIFTIVLTVTELVQWMDDEKWIHLVWIGIALALGFLTRYETIPFAAAVFLTLALFMVKKHRQQRQKEIEICYHNDENNTNVNNNDKSKGKVDSRDSSKRFARYLEGTSIIVFMPLVTSVLLWIFLNWVIMGDPLYFLTSQYSNIVQSAENLGEEMQALIGNIGGVFIFVIKKVFIFLFPLIAILIIRYVNKRLITWETLMLIALVVSIPAFQYIMIIMGNSFGWLRFFVYPLPIVMAWLPYEFSQMKIPQPAFKNIAVYCCVGLVVCNLFTGFFLNNSNLASEEYTTYTQGEASVVLQKEIAEYINNNFSDSIVLMDSFETWYVILSMNSTYNIITTCSYNFEAALENPKEFNVGYILAVNPTGLGVSDAVNVKYSDLFENGVSWCTLEKDFGDYRLYRVTY